MNNSKNILALVLLTILASAPGLFVSPGAAAAQGSVAYNTPPTQEVQPSSLVTITAVSRPLQATAAVSATVPATCENSFSGQGFALQQEGMINLNQPANCFSLGLGQAFVSVKNLAVVQPPAGGQVVVFNRVPVISSPNLVPGPVSSSSPALPISVAVFAVVYALVELKTKKFKTSINLKSFIQQLNIHQLQVMRC